MILHQLAIGMMAISVTVAIHAGFMGVAARFGRRASRLPRRPVTKALAVIAVVMWFFLSICAQCWFWAMLLIGLGAIGGIEEALYFTTVTFTTLGYGDVVLGPDWRLLGAFAATNGTIIVGWTTAMIFVAVQRVYGSSDR
ncbi:Ion channel [Roseovarius mucosus DSM 17069]|uniref:Ion channel n=1 Tax=Roseovarius mucosus DSM 17069 TaxID=1288298 RepID=A0A0A0HMX5_9RHOB|nr:ion channel [Roseovarius mucosus]KGM87438.1 Ion channel [Roseovarius mucosus DSM 17069]